MTETQTIGESEGTSQKVMAKLIEEAKTTIPEENTDFVLKLINKAFEVGWNSFGERYDRILRGDILRELTRTTNPVVWRWWWRLMTFNKQPFYPDANEREFIKKLYGGGRGFSMQKIAFIVKRSSRTVHKIIHGEYVYERKKDKELL